jgi:hypothetical protein
VLGAPPSQGVLFAVVIGLFVRLNHWLIHAASSPSIVDSRHTASAGLPSECTPTVAHRGQFSFDPSTGHQVSDRLRVHIPATQPMANAPTPLPSIAAIIGLPSSPTLYRPWPGSVLDRCPAKGERAPGRVSVHARGRLAD